jgi:hypothetical protein
MNPRIPRRNRLYLAGALPAVVMLFLAAQLGLALKANDDGRSAYDRNAWTDAEQRFLDAPGLIEPWVGPFGAGAAAYRDARYVDAISLFSDALDDVPDHRECDVRRNLALSHEERGDELRARGRQQAAREQFTAGRSALANGDCLDDAGIGLDRRLESKEEGRAPQPDEAADLDPEDKLEELRKRNQERRRPEPEPVDPQNEPDRQIQW